MQQVPKQRPWILRELTPDFLAEFRYCADPHVFRLSSTLESQVRSASNALGWQPEAFLRSILFKHVYGHIVHDGMRKAADGLYFPQRIPVSAHRRTAHDAFVAIELALPPRLVSNLEEIRAMLEPTKALCDFVSTVLHSLIAGYVIRADEPSCFPGDSPYDLQPTAFRINDASIRFRASDGLLQQLEEIGRERQIDTFGVIREMLFGHVYGYYGFARMRQAGVALFQPKRVATGGQRRTRPNPVREWGKNLTYKEFTLPQRLKTDLETLARRQQPRAESLAELVRDILHTRLLGLWFMASRLNNGYGRGGNSAYAGARVADSEPNVKAFIELLRRNRENEGGGSSVPPRALT